MNKIYLRGYIDYNNEKYTFVYEDKKLTLMAVENKFTFFKEYKYVKEFNGITEERYNVIFYIDDNIYYKNGCYICSPVCILISLNTNYSIVDLKIDTLNFSGGIINRFYSNQKMISFNLKENRRPNFKKVEETISKENVILNKNELIFELSISEPGWKNDGIITFDNYNSLLKVKYSHKKDYDSVIDDIRTINTFFEVCSNRKNISYDDVFLETKDCNGKNIMIAKIILPYMEVLDTTKEMLDYDILKNHLSNMFEFLDKCNYIASGIPDQENEMTFLRVRDYCYMFSCFEGIYEYIHSNNKENTTKEDTKLEDVKKEILPLLVILDEKYKGVDGTKRKFIKRFMNIIANANLKLEKCINNELKENEFVLNSIYYTLREDIESNGISNSISKAIKDRDNITHSHIVKLDNISLGIYELLRKLNYVMMLQCIGLSKEIYSEKIMFLGMNGII